MTEKLKKIIERLDVEYPEYKDYEVALVEDDNGILFELIDDEGKTDSEKVSDIKVDINDLLKAQDLMTDEAGYVMEYGHFYDDESFESVADEIENKYGNKITKIIIECLDDENHPTVRYEFTKHLTSDEKDEVDEGIKTLVKEKCADLKLQDLDLDDDYDDDFSIEIYRKGKNDPEFKHDFYSAYKAKEYAIENYINDDSIKEMFIIAHTENGPSVKDYWSKNKGWYNDKLQDADDDEYDSLNDSKNPNAWMTKEYQDELDREFDNEHENSWMTKEYQDELDREFEEEDNKSKLENGYVIFINNNDGYAALVPRDRMDDENEYLELELEEAERLIEKYELAQLEQSDRSQNTEVYGFENKLQDDKDTEEVILDSINHFKNDLGITPEVADIIEDLLANYDVIDEEDTPELTDRLYEEIVHVARRNNITLQGDEKVEDADSLKDADTLKDGSTAVTRQEVIKAAKAKGLTFTADALKDLDWNVIAYINEREISARQWIEEIISGNTEDVSDLFEKTGNYRRYFTDADILNDDDYDKEVLQKALQEIKQWFEHSTSPGWMEVGGEGAYDLIGLDKFGDPVEIVNQLVQEGFLRTRMLTEEEVRSNVGEGVEPFEVFELTNKKLEDAVAIPASTSFWSTRTEKGATAGRITDILLKVRDHLTHFKNKLKPDEQWEAMLPKYIEAGKKFGLNTEALTKAVDFVKTGKGNPWKDSFTEDTPEYQVGDIVEVNQYGQKLKGKIIRAAKPGEVNPGLNNPDAGRYYLVKTGNEKVGYTESLIWEGRLKLIGRVISKAQDGYPDHDKMKAAILEAVGDKIAKLSLREYLNETYVRFIYTQDLTEEEKSDIRSKVDSIVAEHRKLAEYADSLKDADSEGLDDQFKEDAEAIIKELDQVVPIDSYRELDYYTLNIVFGTDSDESDDDAIELMLYFDRYSYELSYRNDNRTNDIDVMRIEDVLEQLGFEIH